MFKTNKDLGLLILRLGAAGMMLTHGIPKISRLFESPIDFPDPLGVGATLSLILALVGEVVAPLLILIGFKTKWAAIPAAITMLVAALVVHADDPFGTKEKALLYAMCFLVLVFTGSGKFAVQKD